MNELEMYVPHSVYHHQYQRDFEEDERAKAEPGRRHRCHLISYYLICQYDPFPSSWFDYLYNAHITTLGTPRSSRYRVGISQCSSHHIMLSNVTLRDRNDGPAKSDLTGN